MTLSPTLYATLTRYQQHISDALKASFERIAADPATVQSANDLAPYYGQMRYHLGWVDASFTPTSSNPGKLLRPTLLLLAYEAAGAWGLSNEQDYLERALPAAASVELTHNFTLIHDDIVDGDKERRHRRTLWSIWGASHGINSGDGMFALSRLALWDVLEKGVEGEIAARLGRVLDRSCLTLAEGQYLDMSFEDQTEVSTAMYIDMIQRKTAALMACAAEMGAMLGTRDQATIESLRTFGEAIGLAFQVRDDLLGVWATTAELGKTEAGDIYRRKKSLPILHALEQASAEDRATLQQIYQQQEPLSTEQVRTVLECMERTGTQAYCRTFLSQYCQRAYKALAQVPRQNNPVAQRALDDMEVMVRFVEEAAH
uniref:Polyprenyl synthetase n=1 Tax=Thermosporothrix sp. COM3 TaxID=2490863 RepID=A0A455SLT7_9CHLR|nr:polyprenyl synthetase [Thermosporothrix sp. COM3]